MYCLCVVALLANEDKYNRQVEYYENSLQCILVYRAFAFDICVFFDFLLLYFFFLVATISGE